MSTLQIFGKRPLGCDLRLLEDRVEEPGPNQDVTDALVAHLMGLGVGAALVLSLTVALAIGMRWLGSL